MQTGFWLIRHAIVAENERARLYGVRDVPLCPQSLVAQVGQYRALAARLPRPAHWVCTPLSRTRRTAEAIGAAGYPLPEMEVVPGLIEQDLGEYQGLVHADLPGRLAAPPHPFWPLGAEERPPGGESFAGVLARVGDTMEELAEANAGREVVAVSHGGAIRAAVAHAMGVDALAALHLSVQNLSLTRLVRHPEGWQVGCVNELLGV